MITFSNNKANRTAKGTIAVKAKLIYEKEQFKTTNIELFK